MKSDPTAYTLVLTGAKNDLKDCYCLFLGKINKMEAREI